MQLTDKTRKILNISLRCVTYLLLAFTAFIMIFTIVTVSTIDRSDRSIFGLKFYIVQTNSMSKSELNADLDIHFDAGDIVIIKNVKDKTTLQAGDVIAFISTNSVNFGETVTHMIREVKYAENGSIEGYVTFGTNTNTNDEMLVEPEYVLGKYSGKLPGTGRFFAFLKSTPGYIICIFVPFLLLIAYNSYNVVRLFRRYRREQMEAMDAERAQIEQDRAENQRMMAELMELKAQLADKQADDAPTAASPEEQQDAPEENNEN